MTATLNAQREIISEELRLAAEQMTPNERVLGDALLDLVGEIDDAAEFLKMLTEEKASDYDAGHALVANEVMRLLFAAGYRAVCEHAAVVGGILSPTVQ